MKILAILTALWIMACVALSQPMPPPAVKPPARYHAAVVTKQASQLKPSAIVVQQSPSVWIGISFGSTNEIQWCSDLTVQNWQTIATTNNLVYWIQVPAPGQQGFYRNKQTWQANPIGCLVSTNAPTQ